jgi:hypothetical protein
VKSVADVHPSNIPVPIVLREVQLANAKLKLIADAHPANRLSPTVVMGQPLNAYAKLVTFGHPANISSGTVVMAQLRNIFCALVNDDLIPNGIMVFRLGQPEKLKLLNPISPVNSRSFVIL